uniref:RNase H type-1 domain-containing protein n=1 Tax=Cannabis sativa TaxID=3483 RepID=A0A803PK57_CANSA
MHVANQEHTSFHTDNGVYYYKVMPFCLKNAEATHKRMINKMIKNQLGRNMEVSIDDMLVISKTPGEHYTDLEEAFLVLRRYRMKLNPKKCTFDVSSRKLGDLLDKPVSELPTWKVYVDGASNEKGTGVGVVLISPQGHQLQSALRLKFLASNNKAEYKAILVGLRLKKLELSILKCTVTPSWW